MKRKLLTNLQAQTILSKYNIGAIKSKHHIDITIENQNYKITTTKGKFLLKIFDSQNREDLQFQNDITDYLHRNNVKVPTLVKNRESETLTNYNDKYLTVYKFIEGKHLKHFSAEIVKNLAKEIAKLHSKLLKYKISRTKQKFNYDSEFLKSVRGEKLQSTVIHGDLGKLNILTNNEEITGIVDFSDARWDFLIKDLAVLTTIFLDEKHLKFMNLFISEYRKFIKLSTDEIKALPLFTLNHIQGVLNWLNHKSKAPTKDYSKHISGAVKYYTKMLKTARMVYHQPK